MRKKIKQVAERLSYFVRRPPIATMLAVWTAVISGGNGLLMIVNPGAYHESVIYNQAMEVASPLAWGAVFLAAAIFVLIALRKGPHEAQLPLLVLVFLFAIMGLFATGAGLEGYVGSPGLLWVGFSGVALIAQWACQEEESNDKATDRKHE